MIIFYIIMAVIVGSLALYSFIRKANDKWSSVDTSDVGLFTFAAILIGLLWFITVWAALIRWGAEGKTPYWFEPLRKIYLIGKMICQR